MIPQEDKCISKQLYIVIAENSCQEVEGREEHKSETEESKSGQGTGSSFPQVGAKPHSFPADRDLWVGCHHPQRNSEAACQQLPFSC